MNLSYTLIKVILELTDSVPYFSHYTFHSLLKSFSKFQNRLLDNIAGFVHLCFVDG